MELYFKAIAFRGEQLLGLISDEQTDLSRVFGKHRLVPFLPVLATVFGAMDWKWDCEVSGVASWAEFEALVRSLDEVDPLSFTFRYPVDTRMNPSLPKHFVINVVGFARHMDGLLDLLSGALVGIEDQWDLSAEAAYFLQQLAGEWKRKT